MSDLTLSHQPRIRRSWIIFTLAICLVSPAAFVGAREQPQDEQERLTSSALEGATQEAVSELRRSAYQMGTKGLVAPVLLSTELPEYTAAAKAAGVQGDVYVEAIVTTDGDVVELKLIRGLGDDELNRRALEALAKWTFEPGTKDSKPVAVVALFTVTYRTH